MNDLGALGIHESWHQLLLPLFEGKQMKQIITEYRSKECYPEIHNIFRVFGMPVEDIKCVLLGQD